MTKPAGLTPTAPLAPAAPPATAAPASPDAFAQRMRRLSDRFGRDGAHDCSDLQPGVLWIANLELRLLRLAGRGLARLQPSCRPPRGTVQELFSPLACTEDPVRAHLRALTGTRSTTFEFGVGQHTFAACLEPLTDEDGHVAGVIGSALDITSSLQRELERSSEHLAQENRRAQRALRTYAGGVAHNYNNLLTTMLGFASLIRDRLSDGVPEHFYAAQIVRAAEAAAELTRQVSLFAQRVPAERTPVDLRQLVSELETELHSCLAPAVGLRLDLAEALPLVLGGASQLRTLLLSLVFNASEAVGTQTGEIVVRTEAVDMNANLRRDLSLPSGVADGAYVHLQVSDTGAGMDEETRARLFEPFFSTRFTGRGLGLAASRGIIESLGGAIAVTSRPGAGTTVHVLVPCCPPASRGE